MTRNPIPNEPPVESSAGPGASSSTPKRKPLAFIVIAVLAIAAGVSAYWWMYLRGIVSTDDAQVEGHIHAISSRVSGAILKVYAKDNQMVKAGELLAELDPQDFEVMVAQKKADLAAARATASSAKASVGVAEKSSASNVGQSAAFVNLGETFLVSNQKLAEQAQADLQARESQYKAATDEFEIRQEMHAKSADTKINMITARNARETAKAQVEGAKAVLASRLAQVEQAIAGIRYAQAKLLGAEAGPLQVTAAQHQASQSEAAVQRSEAELRQAELNLSYTKVYAPADGLVSRKTAETGAHVAAGQPIMAVVELANSWVVANFKETQITHMKPGQKAAMTMDAYPGQTFHGVVDSIAAGTGGRFSLLPPENATGNFVKVVQRVPVKVLVDRPPGAEIPPLRLGMNVIVTVEVGH